MIVKEQVSDQSSKVLIGDRILAVMLLFIVSLMCVQCSSSSTSSTPDPDPQEEKERYQLTVTLRTVEGCGASDISKCRGMKAYIFVDDEAFTRANAPYGRSPQYGGEPVDPHVVYDFQVEEGKWVTIIVFENPGITGRMPQGTTLEDFEDFRWNHVELLRFDGIVEIPDEPGVISFEMKSDANMDVIFQRMPALIVRTFDWFPASSGPGNISVGGWKDFSITYAHWLTWPDRNGQNPLQDSGSYSLTLFNDFPDGLTFAWALKTGTEVTFTPDASEGFAFDRWEGAPGCGSGPCTVTFGEVDEIAGYWKDLR